MAQTVPFLEDSNEIKKPLEHSQKPCLISNLIHRE